MHNMDLIILGLKESEQVKSKQIYLSLVRLPLPRQDALGSRLQLFKTAPHYLRYLVLATGQLCSLYHLVLHTHHAVSRIILASCRLYQLRFGYYPLFPANASSTIPSANARILGVESSKPLIHPSRLQEPFAQLGRNRTIHPMVGHRPGRVYVPDGDEEHVSHASGSGSSLRTWPKNDIVRRKTLCYNQEVGRPWHATARPGR